MLSACRRMGGTKLHFRDAHLGDYYKSQDLRRVMIGKGPMHGASGLGGQVLGSFPVYVFAVSMFSEGIFARNIFAT